MKAVLFGATGMIGQGVLRELLMDQEVEAVLAVGRRATGLKHAKLREIVHRKPIIESGEISEILRPGQGKG